MIVNQGIWQTEPVPVFVDAVCSQIVCAYQGSAGSPSLIDILATLDFICQSASHCARLFISSCKIWQSMGDSMFLYKTQSTAKGRTDDLIFSGRSLIKMRNRTGPKTDP